MQRWRQAETGSLPGVVLDRLLSGASLHDLPLGEVDGRLDLGACRCPSLGRTTRRLGREPVDDSS